MVLLPPEEALHGTLKDAESAVATVAHEEGYAVSRFRSKKSKLGKFAKFDCPAAMAISMQASWQVRVADGTHNHVAPGNVAVYPSARKKSDQVVAKIREMTRAGATPTVVVSAVRQQNSDSLLLSRDVYNERMRARDEALDGREPLVALLGDLQHKNVIHDVAVDEIGRVTYLFFAFPASVQLTRENYQVVLLDSTYKANRFKMFLLHLVGMTATNMTFSIGFCFMQAEREVGYIWATTCAKWCFDQA